MTARKQYHKERAKRVADACAQQYDVKTEQYIDDSMSGLTVTTWHGTAVYTRHNAKIPCGTYLLLVAGEPSLLSAGPEVPHSAAAVRSPPAHDFAVDVNSNHSGYALVSCALKR